MELSKGELMVMEALWEEECLDENGEIQALELSKFLKENTAWERLLAILSLEDSLKKGLLQGVIPNIH